MTIRGDAFRVIQNSPELYRLWHEVRSESERTDMLLSVAFELGMEAGYKVGYAQCDEDVSMGG